MAVTLNANTSTGFIATSDTSGVLQLQTGGTTAVTVDASQNVGLGVTPSAWGSSYKVLQLPGGNIGAFSTTAITTFQNAYDSGTGSYVYLTTAAASRYTQSQGQHQWFNAASGTAGNAITFTQAMTLDASGNLVLGTTASASARLYVRGSGTTSATASFEASNSAGATRFYVQDDGATRFFGSAGSETARITSGGDLLVGTTSNGASSRFVSTVSASGTYQVAGNFTNGADADLQIRIATSLTSIGPSTSTPLIFSTASTERARIASGGQFCVNTTNTNGKLNVSGDIYLFSQTTGAGSHFLKYNSSTGIVTIDTSSRLVKDNIVDSPYGLAEVMQLKSRKYFRTDDQRDEIGLLADEVQAVLPEFVPMSQKSIFTKNEEDTELVASGVYYEKLSSVLIKAIQEQQALIQTLTDRITALEGTTP